MNFDTLIVCFNLRVYSKQPMNFYIRRLKSDTVISNKTQVLLDLPAAFDASDYTILTEALKERFEVDGNAFSWIAEFL